MEFDNEIDALLRKARDDRGVLVGDTLKLHLDADEIAAFAENAVPEGTKQTYVAHFADCEGCRKTLSSVILLNSEAEIETASAFSAPVEAEKVVPWYRKLFLFPNLAYVMGGLVLLFSGFLAMTVLRNSSERAISEVSQINTDEPEASGPNLGFDDSRPLANASNSMASANTSANTMANAANTAANITNTRNPAFAANTAPGNDDSKQAAPSVTTDRILKSGVAPVTAPPPSPPKDQPFTMADKNDLGKTEEKHAVPLKEVDKQKSEAKVMQEQSPSGAGGLFKTQKGPSRNEQRNDMRTRDNELAAKKAAKPEGAIISNRRQVAGKTFDLRQGAWYESVYRGQTTTNVRRGTNDFRKLESGLRYIADNFSGTVVVVWKDKAYRID